MSPFFYLSLKEIRVETLKETRRQRKKVGRTLNLVREIFRVAEGRGRDFFSFSVGRRDGYGIVRPLYRLGRASSLLPGALSNCNLVFMNSLYVAPLPSFSARAPSLPLSPCPSFRHPDNPIPRRSPSGRAGEGD